MTELELVSMHRIDPKKALKMAPKGSWPGTRLAAGPSREHPIIISHSEIKNWKRCRWRHHLANQCRLERLERALPLAMGSLGHEILEQWYALPLAERTPRSMEKIAQRQARITEEKSLTSEERELITAMVVGYAGWAKAEDAMIGVGATIPELEFTLPLTAEGDVLLRGKIDTVFESTKFKQTVGHHEHKFVGRIETGIFEQAEQINMYLWALRQLYPKMRSWRSYPNLLRKQLPGPRVTADLFCRTEEERTDEQINQWAQDTRITAFDMLGAAVYVTPTKDCTWDCDFRNACMLRGQPEELLDVLKTEYKLKEDKKK
jgi:hypothetical protein